MVRLFKKATTPPMSVQKALEYTANSRARADADKLRAEHKAAEAEVLIAELKSHAKRLEKDLLILLRGE